MSYENPYQAPRTDASIRAEFDGDGLWQCGKLLIMRRDALLPDRCVKSNEPTTRRLKRQLIWHHPAVYLALLANVLIYAILALCLQKRATIRIGLSDKWIWKRRRAIMIGWGSVLVSLGMLFVGVSNVDRGGPFAWLIFGAIFLFLAGAIYGLIAARMVAATRIDDTYIWLKGVHPSFFADLPYWPH